MNMQPPETLILSSSETKAIVSKNLGVFVRRCLESDFDKIVPIEGEGLAVLLPYLADYPHKASDIIPSNSVKFVPDGILRGKKVLVLDVSVSTGHTLFKVAQIIKEKTGVEPALAALLVRKEFDQPERLFFQDYLSLLPNAYNWAREVIIEFLLNEVFVHPTDPPLWEIKFPESHKGALIKSLLRFSGSYSLEPTQAEDAWIRITIDKIALRHSDWLGGMIANDANNKIRVIVNRKKNIARILPLFFPLINTEKRVPISKLIEGAARRLPSEFNKVLENAEKIESQNPYVAYNWVASVGSLLLFNDFIVLLRNHFPALKIDEVRLAAPVPNIYQYSCDETILKAFEEVAKKFIDTSEKSGQMEFHDPTFIFSSVDSHQIAEAFVMPEHLKYLTSEQALIYALGTKVMEMRDENEDEDLDNGFSLAEIENKAQYMNSWAVSYAVDRLVDEGILKPRVGNVSPGYIGRVYVIAGETVRNRLEYYGLVAKTLGSFM
jgi:hypothetical protein